MYGRKQLSNNKLNHQEIILCQTSDRTKMSEKLLVVLLKWSSNMDTNGMLLESLHQHLQEITVSPTLGKTMTFKFQRPTLQVLNKDLDHGTLRDIQLHTVIKVLFSLKLMLTKDQTLSALPLAALSTSKRKLVWDIQLTIQFQTMEEIEI
jgi:hypothetical protein